MNPYRLLPALMFFTASLSAESLSVTAQQSGLTQDPKLVVGSLKNGLRYAILPNAEPPDRVSVRLYVDAGSLMETDTQRGLAHFLEHMAFNGTEHFPAGEMVAFFQRLGMSFGGDTNAHTSFKETVYKLELPQGDDESINRALLLFHDFLNGMLLDQKEIDHERGIILSEKLSRDSVQNRMLEEGYKFALPNALISERFPIGQENIIKNAGRPEFVDFYKKWYVTGRAWLIVTGNVNPSDVEKKIQTQFQGIPAREVAPDPAMGRVDVGQGLRVKFYPENELPYVALSIDTGRPYKKIPDSAKRRVDVLNRDLADMILNRRFELLTKKENSPLLSASSNSGDFLDFVYSAGIETMAKPDQWKEALESVEQEIRRAVEYGFTDVEVKEATATLLNTAQTAALQATTRQSANLADDLVESITHDRVFTTPGEDLKIVQEALKDPNLFTAKSIHEAFKKDWSTGDTTIFVGGKLDLKDGDKKIAEVWKNSADKAVEPPAQEAEVKFAYTNFGTPGQVVGKEVIEDLGITRVTFANHVALNLQATDFKKNEVLVQISIGGGRLDAIPSKEYLLTYADAVFIAGGLEKHSSDDLDRIFAGKTIRRSFSVEDDAFSLEASTETADLTLQLQTLCAYVVAPGYRPEADRLFKSAVDSLYGQIDHSMEGVLRAKMPRLLRSGDKRFGFPEREDLEKATPADLKAFLTPVLEKGWMEINLVGDFKVDAAIKAVAATFGALPDRQAEKPAYTEQSKVVWPKGKEDLKLSFTTKVPKGLAAIVWPTADIWDVKRTRRLSLLGDVLDDRLRVKIREQLGESYSPFACNMPSDTFTGYGVMAAMVIVNPHQMADVKKALVQIQDELLAGNVSTDEMKRVVEPRLTALKQQQRDNDYWLTSVLRGSRQHPEKYDWARSLMEDVSSIKPEDMKPLIEEYLAKGRQLFIEVAPLPFKE